MFALDLGHLEEEDVYVAGGLIRACCFLLHERAQFGVQEWERHWLVRDAVAIIILLCITLTGALNKLRCTIRAAALRCGKKKSEVYVAGSVSVL